MRGIRVTPVNDETYVINDPLCECGSTITVRRLEAPTWGKPAESIKAFCTDHPHEGHPLPVQVRLLVASRRGQPG